MSKLLNDRDFIESCKETPFDLGNDILYKLCSDYPKHNKGEEIIAKVWLIGRAYAVALERNKKKVRESNDTFYKTEIVTVFKNSNIDYRLKELEAVDEANYDSLTKSLEIHGYFTESISKITGHNNRSFCSKYLHFHSPNSFFIYDSRAVSALRKLKINIKEFPVKFEKFDKEYAQFSYKCFQLQKIIFRNTGVQLSKRQLDNLLLEVSQKK